MPLKDKEKHREYKRRYRQAHKERCKAYWRHYYQEHKEQHKAYYEAHREQILEKRRKCNSATKKNIVVYTINLIKKQLTMQKNAAEEFDAA